MDSKGFPVKKMHKSVAAVATPDVGRMFIAISQCSTVTSWTCTVAYGDNNLTGKKLAMMKDLAISIDLGYLANKKVLLPHNIY